MCVTHLQRGSWSIALAWGHFCRSADQPWKIMKMLPDIASMSEWIWKETQCKSMAMPLTLYCPRLLLIFASSITCSNTSPLLLPSSPFLPTNMCPLFLPSQLSSYLYYAVELWAGYLVLLKLCFLDGKIIRLILNHYRHKRESSTLSDSYYDDNFITVKPQLQALIVPGRQVLCGSASSGASHFLWDPLFLLEKPLFFTLLEADIID